MEYSITNMSNTKDLSEDLHLVTDMLDTNLNLNDEVSILLNQIRGPSIDLNSLDVDSFLFGGTPGQSNSKRNSKRYSVELPHLTYEEAVEFNIEELENFDDFLADQSRSLNESIYENILEELNDDDQIELSKNVKIDDVLDLKRTSVLDIPTDTPESLFDISPPASPRDLGLSPIASSEFRLSLGNGTFDDDDDLQLFNMKSPNSIHNFEFESIDALDPQEFERRKILERQKQLRQQQQQQTTPLGSSGGSKLKLRGSLQIPISSEIQSPPVHKEIEKPPEQKEPVNSPVVIDPHPNDQQKPVDDKINTTSEMDQNHNHHEQHHQHVDNDNISSSSISLDTPSPSSSTSIDKPAARKLSAPGAKLAKPIVKSTISSSSKSQSQPQPQSSLNSTTSTSVSKSSSISTKSTVPTNKSTLPPVKSTTVSASSSSSSRVSNKPITSSASTSKSSLSKPVGKSATIDIVKPSSSSNSSVSSSSSSSIISKSPNTQQIQSAPPRQLAPLSSSRMSQPQQVRGSALSQTQPPSSSSSLSSSSSDKSTLLQKLAKIPSATQKKSATISGPTQSQYQQTQQIQFQPAPLPNLRTTASLSSEPIPYAPANNTSSSSSSIRSGIPSSSSSISRPSGIARPSGIPAPTRR